MDRIELLPYHRIYRKEKVHINGRFKLNIDTGTALLFIISFLVSKSLFLNETLPFGLAFYAASLKKDKKYILALMPIVVGILTVNATLVLKYLLAFAIFIGIYALIKNYAITLYALFASLLQISIMLLNDFNNLLLYDLIVGVMSAAACFTMTIIFYQSIPSIINLKRRLLSKEEMISVAITLGIILSGFSGLNIAGLSASHILGILTVIVFGFTGGAGIGCSVGLVLGLITTMARVDPLIISTYAFSGLLSGVFNKTGKIGSIMGFALGFIIMSLYMPVSSIVIKLYEVGFAVLIFIVLPRSFIDTLCEYVDTTLHKEKALLEYNTRMKEITAQKIKEIAAIFGEISSSMNECVENKAIQKELGRMVDNVANKICIKCSRYNQCWKEHFYNTYKGIYERIEALEYGAVPVTNFKDRCMRFNEINAAISSLHTAYIAEAKWKSRMQENSYTVMQQFKGISEILYNLSKDLNHDVEFVHELEENIKIELDRAGFEVRDVYVLRKDKRMEVQIFKKICYGKKECVKDIAPIVSRCTGKKMVVAREHDLCDIDDKLEKCRLRLVEADRYRVETGVVSASKEEVNGDNFDFLELPYGKYMIALSDGMGTGKRAYSESKLALKLIERFIKAGFSKDVAVKSVNSLLALRSPDDIFTTLDMCFFDRYNGEAGFIKMGSSSTFIKKGDEVDVIRSTELPIGIINEVEVSVKHRTLEDGDIVVMVTDGVLESAKILDREHWIKQLLKELSSTPQEMAKAIADSVLKISNGKVNDDMTVLVSKVVAN